MAKYKTKRALLINGKKYKVGEIIHLKPEDAKRFGKDIEPVNDDKKKKTTP